MGRKIQRGRLAHRQHRLLVSLESGVDLFSHSASSNRGFLQRCRALKRP
jgi:hypothetical protein